MKGIFLCATLTLTFINHSHVFCQSFLVNAGARSFGIGDANVCLSDVYSSFNNPAGIADQNQIHLSASTKILYQGTDLRSHYLSAIYPMRKFSISLGLLKHGNNYLNQQKIGLAIANKIGFVKLGVQAGYYQLRAEGFGTTGNIVFDFGGIAELTEKITFGAHIFNFTQSSIEGEESIPIIMKAGIHYAPVPIFNTYLEIEKEIAEEPMFKIGIEYEIISSLFVQTGVTINPTKHFFGLQYSGKRVGFGYSLSYHQILGMIHQASLEIKFKKHEGKRS